MIRSFVFDIGNVLLPFDFGIALSRLEPLCTRPVADAMERGEPLKSAYEEGRIGKDEFVKEAIALLGYTGEPEEFERVWADIFHENKAMTELVAALHGHYPLYILSNTSDIHINAVLANFSVFRHFADAVYSFKVGCSKPGCAIYELAAKQFAIDPRETVFIDDLPANVEGARSVGYHGILYDFRNHAALLAELAALGVNV